MLKKIKTNIALAPLTTFKVGGNAEYFFELEKKEEILQIFNWAESKNLKITILGGGSNVLISDQGIKGLVILMKNNKAKVRGERIEAESGAVLDHVLGLALNSRLSGLEWAKGIPRATIGGAIRGNAEAFNCPISALVETVLVFDIKKKKFDNLSNKLCAFAYRDSIFKQKENFLIWSAVLRLAKKEKKEIEALLENSLSFRMQKYPKLPSAGSVFMNLDPEIIKKNNKELFEKKLQDKIGRQNMISAGLIIDLLGLKGKTIGGAKVSLEHANHIVNTGRASADEIAQLISLIKTKARHEFNLNLREEVQYLGF